MWYAARWGTQWNLGIHAEQMGKYFLKTLIAAEHRYATSPVEIRYNYLYDQILVVAAAEKIHGLHQKENVALFVNDG